MAPNKLEDRIREQLQEREIQPSKDAWSKMEARLGKEARSGRSFKVWYAVAASFVGIIILASIFFYSDNSQTDLVIEDETIEIPMEVDNQSEIEEVKAPEIVSSEDSEDEVADEVAITDEVQDNSNSKPIVYKTIKEQKMPPLVAEVRKKDDVQVEEKEIEDKLIITPELEEETFIQSKVDEVVAEVGKIQDSGKEIKAEDIDQLLLNAQKEISKRRILNSPKKVDAAALLSDVETELERSFRDKVFDALGDGFSKIRTAVAERNY